MSDFDRLIKNLARAGELASRARQGDEKVIDELIDSLRAYTGESSNTYESEASSKGPNRPEEAQPHPAGIDKTIVEYQATKDAMAAIINKHMRAAFEEIRTEYGTTPTDVTLCIDQQQAEETKYPSGDYAGSRVRLGGE
jgi:hypothetical protein